MSKVTIRNLIIASVFLAIILSAFAYSLFVTEKQNQLLTEQLTTLEKKQVQENTYRKMQRIAEESAADRQLLASYFLDQESDSIDFLNTVEALAPQAGVVLKTDSLQKDTDKKTKKEWLTVKFTFNGEYQNVTDFIKTLENIPYLAEITEVVLKARASDNWEANVTMRVNLYSYDDKE